MATTAYGFSVSHPVPEGSDFTMIKSLFDLPSPRLSVSDDGVDGTILSFGGMQGANSS